MKTFEALAEASDERLRNVNLWIVKLKLHQNSATCDYFCNKGKSFNYRYLYF